jgi:hypothetical protein
MTYVTKITEKWQFDALVTIAKERQLSVCTQYQSEGHEKWPWFAFRSIEDEIIGMRTTDFDSTQISFEQMIEKLMKFVPYILHLNGECTAILNREERFIEVGCQKFTFEKIEELYNFIKLEK